MTQRTSSDRENIGSTTEGTATSAAREVADQAKQTAGQIADQAQQRAGQVVDQARQQVTSGLSVQKDRAAERLGSVAQALRQTSQQLGEQDQAGVSQYIDRAASQVERISGYLQRSDMGQLIDDVEHFARSQPALFLGGAFVLGLIGARFLKSSRPPMATTRYPPAQRQNMPFAQRQYMPPRRGIYNTGYSQGSGTVTGTYGGATGAYGGATRERPTGAEDSYGGTAGAYGGATRERRPTGAEDS